MNKYVKTLAIGFVAFAAGMGLNNIALSDA